MNPFESTSLTPCDAPKMIGSVRNLTLTEQLESRKADLEARLLEINAALEGLKKNPDVEVLLNLISKVRY